MYVCVFVCACTRPGARSLLGEVAIIILNAYEHVELIEIASKTLTRSHFASQRDPSAALGHGFLTNLLSHLLFKVQRTIIAPSGAVIVIVASQVFAISQITMSITVSMHRVTLSPTKRRAGERYYGSWYQLNRVKLGQIARATGNVADDVISFTILAQEVEHCGT